MRQHRKDSLTREISQSVETSDANRPYQERPRAQALKKERSIPRATVKSHIKTVADISQVKKGGERSPPIRVTMSVSGVDLDFEVDTGALMGEAD